MPLTLEIQKQIFEKIKSVLQKQTPPMVVSKNTKDCFELMEIKRVSYGTMEKPFP